MSELTALNFLLKATSKAVVEKCVSLVFTSRLEPAEDCVEFIKVLLELDNVVEAQQLRTALLKCIEVTLSSGAIEDLAELFQSAATDVNPKLTKLVGQTIASKLEAWKEASALNRVSLPKLVDVDWTIHVKTASSQVSRMKVPVVIVGLQVEDQPQTVSQLPATQRVDFELSREALSTMLDGLGKIRDQLSAMG